MPSTHRLALLAAAALAAALVLPACRHAPQDFVWVGDVPTTIAAAKGDRYLLGPGDVIGIRVFNQESSSIDRTTVREDGRISLPLLYDVDVAGMQPAELARRLEVKLKPYVVTPIVTVIVHERRPLRIYVVGEVRTPGAHGVDPDAGVLQALAAAGGLTDFAHRDRIFVLRNGYWADTDTPGRIRFDYRALARGTPPAATFRLKHGDTIVAE
jgi:polysaccharide export outer membrane protein